MFAAVQWLCNSSTIGWGRCHPFIIEARVLLAARREAEGKRDGAALARALPYPLSRAPDSWAGLVLDRGDFPRADLVPLAHLLSSPRCEHERVWWVAGRLLVGSEREARALSLISSVAISAARLARPTTAPNPRPVRPPRLRAASASFPRRTARPGAAADAGSPRSSDTAAPAPAAGSDRTRLRLRLRVPPHRHQHTHRSLPLRLPHLPGPGAGPDRTLPGCTRRVRRCCTRQSRGPARRLGPGARRSRQSRRGPS